MCMRQAPADHSTECSHAREPGGYRKVCEPDKLPPSAGGCPPRARGRHRSARARSSSFSSSICTAGNNTPLGQLARCLSVSRAVQVWVWAGRTTPQASAPGCVAAWAAAQCPRGCSGRGARFHAARHAARQTSRARHTAHDALRTTAHCAQRALSCAQRALSCAHSPLATAHSAQHARAKHIVHRTLSTAQSTLYRSALPTAHSVPIILCTARPSPARRRP